MDKNPNVNRALSALLKELEHIKDLTSMAEGYREVAHELSTSVEDYHKLNSAHIEQMCQLAEKAEKANSERINLAQEQFSASLSRIAEICESVNTQEIIDRLDKQKEYVENLREQIIDDINGLAHQHSKTIDRIDQNESRISKNLTDAVKDISQEISTIKEHANQVVRDSSEKDRLVFSELISKIESKIVDLEAKVSELPNRIGSDIAEQSGAIIAFVKKNNDSINEELQTLQSNLSDIKSEINSLKKLGYATIIGIILLVCAVIISICL